MAAILTRNTDNLRKEVAAHLDAGALIRDIYWTAADNAVGGKGNFIGCLTHSNDPKPAYERFGLPIAVMRIAGNIFGALPDDEGRAFFASLPDAVWRDGKDLSRVHWAFLSAELRALPKTTDAVQAVIDPIIDGMDLLAAGKDWSADTARSAAKDARAVARVDADADADVDAAAHAAYAAARADVDAAAAFAAAAAALAAAADYAVAFASADYAAARIRQRDTLLALIAAA